MKLTGLTPDREGNQILLLDSDGIIQGEIAAPFLIDANSAMSTDIELELVNQGGDSYRLTYRPSITWLQEEGRAYPVVLDPPVTFHSNVSQQVEDNLPVGTSIRYEVSLDGGITYEEIITLIKLISQ